MAEVNKPQRIIVVAESDTHVAGTAVGPVERVERKGLWVKLPVAVVVRPVIEKPRVCNDDG